MNNNAPNDQVGNYLAFSPNPSYWEQICKNNR